MKELKNTEIIAWFMGPKGEHGDMIKNFLLDIWIDYTYWRRNYYPQDGIAFTMKEQREVISEIDNIKQLLMDLLSKMKRNFPFYSPRYIAHMLSETSIPSVLGYFTGMIYNPNNVTPEAAPVTVELEIEAVNEVLKMVGFNPPPEPPSTDDEIQIRSYENALKREFGWGHIVSGGTLANLEALWVASLVRYSAINIKNICSNEKINLKIKLPRGNEEYIYNVDDFQLLTIKPNESIYLLSKFILAIKQRYELTSEDAIKKAHELLEKGTYNISNGIYKLFQKYPPIIFVSRAAHYSIDKAASILGIGKNNVIKVDVDSMFRLDIKDLEDKIKNFVLDKKYIPLAVIPIAGTTEEGAIDPIHKVVDLRKKLEADHNISFWIHIDAAWGGFLRSLLTVTTEEEINTIIKKIHQKNPSIIKTNSIEDFLNSLTSLLNDEHMKNKIQHKNRELLDLYNTDKNKFLKKFKQVMLTAYKDFISEDDLRINLNDRVKLVEDFVRDKITLSYSYRAYKENKIKNYVKKVQIKWGFKDVIGALLAFPYAESITIDPHKLGYIPYPCGMIVYRNDRIRHFILQKAPYITSSKHNILLHNPPKHWNKKHNKVEIDAFGPFIIEGSRPGASATALWLSIKSIPLNKSGYGLILKYSLLAARELYEWLNRWNKMVEQVGKDTRYNFITLTENVPDTNIVISHFLTKIWTCSGLGGWNWVGSKERRADLSF